MMWGDWSALGWWPMWMGFGGLMMIGFWVLVVLGIVWAVRAVSGPTGTPPPPAEAALDIVKKRYARGEITKEQFEEMKRDLG